MSARRGRRNFNNKGKFGDKCSNFPRKSNEGQNWNYNRQDKYNQFVSQQRLSEGEVGISEYLSDLPGFTGVIKARYSDFHVNEINSSQEIAKLTDTSAPKDFNSDTDADARSLDVISQETWDKIDEMVNSAEESTVEIDVTSVSKEDRTKIHKGVKKVFGQKIIASTKTVDEKKFIELKKYTKGAQKDMRFEWPEDKGEYVHFLVYKESVDTIEANFKISDCLRMKPSAFTYAGVKDKRAKTTQWFSVKKVKPLKLINKTRCLRNIHIGNISFKNEPLKLGQLSGNRFRIALRNVTADDALINETLASLNSKGFINYYGLQRFGNDKDVPTFEIGIKLLQGNWKEACNLILKPKSSDDPQSDVTHAKRTYKDSSDSNLACKQFNRSHNKCVESKLLIGLAKNNENDYVNALENIPRNMRLLYIHSFQSFVWNQIVSRRIKEFGLKPLVGDIVLLSEQLDEVVQDTEETDESNEESVSNATNNCDIKVLTHEDLDNYSAYDIVLPLPGYDIKYPENEIKNWYEDILKEHNLTLEMPKQKVKTYTLSGSYRKILGRASDLSWKTVRYDHPNDTLIRSDYEELRGDEEPKDNPEGKYKALIVDFCLSSSCYATMVLREILKMDTSSSAHAKLSKYHEDDPKEKSQFPEADSLLSDAAKYEEFKQQIFGATGDVVKRKDCEESEESNVSKKVKTVDEEGECGIKIQPTLL